MANKPAQICQLQKGKLIDTQKGFVDTFNWAVQSIANLKGGENCEVTWPTDDTPTIDCNSSEDTGGSDGGITNAVYDVIEDTQDDKDGITIQYTDDREDSFIPFPSLSGGGEITIAGTDGSSHEGDTFTFESATDSNVIVTVDGDGVMKIGVYYL